MASLLKTLIHKGGRRVALASWRRLRKLAKKDELVCVIARIGQGEERVFLISEAEDLARLRKAHKGIRILACIIAQASVFAP